MIQNQQNIENEMSRISDLSLFLRVLETGSISAAARYESLSLAVASQRLQRLERELGVRLLNRSTRSMYPTPEGQTLADQGRPLIEELVALGQCLRDCSTTVAGHLRVTMSASFGRIYVSPLLSEFQTMYPKVNISAHLSDDMVDIIKEGFDLAIRMGPLQDSRLVVRPLSPDPRVLVASPDYLNKHGTPLHPDDLSSHDGLFLLGREGRQDIWPLSTPNGGLIKVKMSGNFESNLGEVLRDAALSGLGISYQSVWSVASDLKHGRLRVVLPEYPGVPSQINAITPTRSMQSRRVQAFVDFLAEKFADPLLWERTS
ncbi:LysR family transcriptional regulator [Pectobacterium polonicum]|uniref:LysR family transcriptional regulator n=2 Tax=Pectobacterium polonicum TaxID=2485124 RepID=UPI0037545FEE